MVTDVSRCKQIQEFTRRELRRCPFDYFLLQKEDVRHQVKEWDEAQRWKAGSCLFYLNFFFPSKYRLESTEMHTNNGNNKIAKN